MEQKEIHQGEGQRQGQSDHEDEEMPLDLRYGHIEGGAGGDIRVIEGGARGAIGVIEGGDEDLCEAVLGGMIELDEVPAHVQSLGDQTQKAPFFLTSEQELEVVEWLVENPIFHKKTPRRFRSMEKDKKKELMKAQAYKMKVNFYGLYRWCRGMRERNARMVLENERNARMVLENKSSEVARLRRTEREKWILSNFSFQNDPQTLG